jgi:hypothetical protein
MAQQNSLQYMQMMEERRRATLEQQNNFFQELLQHNRIERPENQESLCLTSRTPNQYPLPMNQSQWMLKIC